MSVGLRRLTCVLICLLIEMPIDMSVNRCVYFDWTIDRSVDSVLWGGYE